MCFNLKIKQTKKTKMDLSLNLIQNENQTLKSELSSLRVIILKVFESLISVCCHVLIANKRVLKTIAKPNC